MNEILVNVEMQEKRVAIVKDGLLDEYYIEHPADKTIVGNIYKGKIDSIVPSIGAAFVDIGFEKNGFLYLSDVATSIEPIAPLEQRKKEFKKGEEVLVQVVKEPISAKGPRLTTHIGLAGRYLVLMPQDTHRGVSRRIEDRAEKTRLLGLLEEVKVPTDIGYIIRTVALGKEKRQLQHDVLFLLKLWRRTSSFAERNNAPSLIYEDYDIVLRVIRDSFSDEINKLIVDSKDEFRRIRNFLRVFSNDLLKKITLYQGAVPLFLAKNIERQIGKIYESKVFLKSGAYLIIEPTEGLVVIDVNSGRFRKKNNPEQMALAVNSEAASEVARQLRLRDLGGIIVIDFIDMEREEHRREVLRILKNSLKDDKAKYEILGISKFGLVEMTRERVYRTIESLSYSDCPYCHGRGKIKSVPTMAIWTLKELKRQLLENPSKKEFQVAAHPDVINRVLRDNEKSIETIEKRYRVKVGFTLTPNAHIEEVKIV
jgi:ribonuclease G